MRHNTIKYLTLIIAGVLFVSSCIYKPLEFENIKTTKVKIKFDWKKVKDTKATGMDLWLFPKNGEKPLLYSFVDIQGGEINVPFGVYKAVWMNSESKVIKYSKENSWDEFNVFTGLSMDSANPFKNIKEGDINEDNEIIVSPVDKYYSGYDENIKIDRPDKKALEVILEPEDRVCTYTVEVRGVENLKYALGVTAGALSGVSGSYLPSHSELGKEPSFIVFPCSADKHTSNIMAEFRTFGSNDMNRKHELVLFFKLGDGSRWYTKVDVSDQVNNAVDKCNVHIIVDHLTIPKPIVNGSGFHPSVDGWGDEENIYIKIF